MISKIIYDMTRHRVNIFKERGSIIKENNTAAPTGGSKPKDKKRKRDRSPSVKGGDGSHAAAMGALMAASLMPPCALDRPPKKARKTAETQAPKKKSKAKKTSSKKAAAKKSGKKDKKSIAKKKSYGLKAAVKAKL